MKHDYRTELIHEVNILHNWLDRNAYEESYTQRSAKEALEVIKSIWPILERRKGSRNGEPGL